jgi:adenylate kinase family enzyme
MTAQKRIQLIGGSGSGKSTIAQQLAQRLNATYCDLDDLHWDPQWTEVPDEVMLARLAPIVAQERWVIAGNYKQTWPMLWPKLDLLIWLDLPLHVKVWRTLRRSLARAWRREPCCNGNYESLPRLFTRDSVVLYLLQTHAQRQREYAALMNDATRPPFAFVRLRTQREVTTFIEKLADK